MGCSIMSELKVDTIVNLAGTGKPNLPVSPTLGGAAISAANTYSYTSSGTEPSSPKNGAIWWDSSNNKVMVYINGEFKNIELNGTYSSFDWGGDRGIVAGIASGSNKDLMYFDISGSGGNSTDFGDLTVERSNFGAGGSPTRACFSGGYSGATPNRNPTIDYVTPSSPGNCTDFGDLTAGRNVCASASNGTRLLNAGGYITTGYVNTVDYITVANTGNATDFGDLSGVGEGMHGGGVADLTRAVFGGGIGGSTTNTIDYFTIASTGNATDFGDLVLATSRNTGCSDATRGVFCGGSSAHSPAYRNMEYITIQTTGNGTDFGDLTESSSSAACTSNSTIGVHIAGDDMEKFTIQTAANATDFGDILQSKINMAASSGNPS